MTQAVGMEADNDDSLDTVQSVQIFVRPVSLQNKSELTIGSDHTYREFPSAQLLL